MRVSKLIRPLIAAGFFGGSGMVLASETPQLECQLRITNTAVAGQPLMLEFALHNRGATAWWVLDWNTPLEGWRNRFLRVSGPHGELDYQGPMFKRGQPMAGNYRRLEPGATLRAELDLRQAYRLDQAGRYHIGYHADLLDAMPGAQQPPRNQALWQPVGLACSPVAVVIGGRS